MNRKLEVLFIRHAVVANFLDSINPRLVQRKTQKFYRIDPDISIFGKIESNKLRKANIEELDKVKLVLCTPTRRTLSTARLMFNTTEPRNNLPRLVAVPICEYLFEIHRFSPASNDLLAEFSEFDFSQIEEDRKELGPFWFLSHVAKDPNIQTLFKDYTKEIQLKNPNMSDEDFLYKFLEQKEFKSQIFRLINFNMNHRVVLFEFWLREFLKLDENKDLKDGEIAFVGHSYLNGVLIENMNEINLAGGNRDNFNCQTNYFTISTAHRLS